MYMCVPSVLLWLPERVCVCVCVCVCVFAHSLLLMLSFAGGGGGVQSQTNSDPHSEPGVFHSRVSVLVLPGGSDVIHPAEQHPGLFQFGGVHRRPETHVCVLTQTQRGPG